MQTILGPVDFFAQDVPPPPPDGRKLETCRQVHTGGHVKLGAEKLSGLELKLTAPESKSGVEPWMWAV